jgi:hypothetical protein
MNMDIKECIELLLNRINTRNQFVGGTFAAFGGTAGNIQLLQKEANAAISLWHEKHDTSGLKQLAAMLQAYGNLSDDEYQQVMETLDGVK